MLLRAAFLSIVAIVYGCSWWLGAGLGHTGWVATRPSQQPVSQQPLFKDGAQHELTCRIVMGGSHRMDASQHYCPQSWTNGRVLGPLPRTQYFGQICQDVLCDKRHVMVQTFPLESVFGVCFRRFLLVGWNHMLSPSTGDDSGQSVTS